MSRRAWQLVAVLAAAGILVGTLILISQAGDDTPDPASEEVAGAAEAVATFRGIPQDGIALGDPEAPVTLTEFADLQCPFCREFAVDVLPTVVERYVRTGQVRMVFRNLSFLGEDSVRAALGGAAAARQDRLWQYAEVFFRNQGTENSGYVTDDFLRKIAGAVPGLDAERVVARANGPAEDPQLTAADAAAERFGVQSTPSFMVESGGGPAEPLEVSELSVDAFASALDEQLDR